MESVLTEIIVLLLLLLLSAVFSSSETALISLSLARAKSLYDEQRPGSSALIGLKKNPDKMLITILLGNNLVNIAASAMATVLATKYFGKAGPAYAVGALTLLILVFGEITPKSIATKYAERLSLFLAPFIILFMRATYPCVLVLSMITQGAKKWSRSDGDPIVTESELINMAEHGEEEGMILSEEREMIERIFEFNDLIVEDVMTPRHRMFMLEASQTVKEIVTPLLENSYSRVPVFESDPDDAGSVLYLRDVLEAVAKGMEDKKIGELAREALFVPENQPIDELFSSLRAKRMHMALAVDEHGTIQGLVTMEDLIEEIVGEIFDESDENSQFVKELEPGKLQVHGMAELRELEEYFDLDFTGKGTDSASWWILEHIERIPKSGEDIEIQGLKVHVEKASNRKILQLIVSKSPSLEDQATG